MTEFDKMIAGEAFDGGDASVDSVRNHASLLLAELNGATDDTRRSELYQQLFHHYGTGSIIRSPFFCEFGQTIEIGAKTFINMNATFLDGAPIKIGNHVLIGPNAQFYTASHSLDHMSRRNWETFCKPIVVEDDVWIGGNVVINQGVTIGARSVIAANSVVTKDVEPDCLYGGTPAKLIRRLQAAEK
ncbi:sugar O-acetyltransferase [Vibrio panuliri]|uniref:Nodulation protein L n=1 Tax=Vibrio panuliri TaxID=1381081 RepID=A0A1Q9HJL4_9VIBR|nr:sugar O-acetyltransferase [Vibrio panuliri]KAB1453932.1 sugar O-acetyltransferase [Vibrio panuliri]OLQ83997.1 acetyltransferase [Vibrio panuliri]OLQ90522.1 acetyltransferase [Vibrio panuliri]